MLNERNKRRKVSAMAPLSQHMIAMLRRTLMVMLPVWLVYFFAIRLFVTNLNAITVPLVGLPLGTYLVAQGSVLAFAVLLVLLIRTYPAASRQ
jgi:putative solute:sodium symporter small subunit